MTQNTDWSKAFEERIAGLSQLREPTRASLSPSLNGKTVDSSNLQVYQHVVRNGVGESVYKGETDWEAIYKLMLDKTIDVDDAASDVSDDEYHKTHHQDDWDWNDELNDDRSVFSSYSNVSQASHSTSTSSLQFQRKHKSTDEEIKIAAYSMTFCEISRPCKCAKSCSANITFDQVCREVLPSHDKL